MSNVDGRRDGPLWRRPRLRWLLGIPLGAFIAFFAGAAVLGTFNWVVHQTSKTDFCLTACHSHQAFVRPEYEASSHFRNRSGVRAECADCHLPRGWWRVLKTKIAVSADIIPELLGELDTEQEWEAHRLPMAEKVWDRYRSNDSEYCRHCHDPASMDRALQSPIAAKMHARLGSSGQTCIDCHRGLVHALPQQTAAD